MGEKQKKDQTERRNAKGLRQKNKRGDMWDQTGSPKIPDRGETSKIHGLPSGVLIIKCIIYYIQNFVSFRTWTRVKQNVLFLTCTSFFKGDN